MLTDGGALFTALLPLLGLLLGVYSSFAGLGGGMIMTPVLSVVFGLPYPEAIACSVAQMVGTSASGFWRHWRLGHIDWRLAGSFLTGSLPGAVTGRLLLQHLSERYGAGGGLRTAFNAVFACLLIASGLMLTIRLMRLRRARGTEHRCLTRAARLQSAWARGALLAGSGFLAGAMAGLLSIGGGIVTVPVLVGLLGVPVTVAVGTSVLQMSLMAVAATVTSLGGTELNWPVILLLTVGSVPGAAIGPALLRALSGRFRLRRDGGPVSSGP
jgi:uncharacterized membrane protein YfcA